MRVDYAKKMLEAIQAMRGLQEVVEGIGGVDHRHRDYQRLGPLCDWLSGAGRIVPLNTAAGAGKQRLSRATE
jgi:hypothetical protein